MSSPLVLLGRKKGEQLIEFMSYLPQQSVTDARKNATTRAEELLLDTCKDLAHLRKMLVQWFVDLGIKEGNAEEVREESKIWAWRTRSIEANGTQTHAVSKL